MHFDDLYRRHPALAFGIQTATACALGYITHQIQQQWYAENLLLLHVAIWWVLLVLILLQLHSARQSLGKKASTAPVTDREVWPEHIRLNALCEGTAPWFLDANAESLHDDLPVGGPLFRSICLRMPNRWELDRLETTIASRAQTATFGGGQLPCFELGLHEWETGWRISVTPRGNANQDRAREFLLDLQQVLETTNGITRVRWYHDSMLQGGQMTASDYALGTHSPLDSPATSG